MSELATINNSDTLDLARGYSSITSDDIETKKLVYAAVTSAEALKDHLGEELVIVDVLSQPITEVDDKTGETEEYTRITLIAADGKAYSASSTGVLNSLHTAFKIFGEPSQWEAGLTFKPREVQSPNNKAWRYVTLDVV